MTVTHGKITLDLNEPDFNDNDRQAQGVIPSQPEATTHNVIVIGVKGGGVDVIVDTSQS